MQTPEIPGKWILYATSERYRYWYHTKDHIFNCTPIAEGNTPPDTVSGYFEFETLRKLKNDISDFTHALDGVTFYSEGYNWKCPRCGTVEQEDYIPRIAKCAECGNYFATKNYRR